MNAHFVTARENFLLRLRDDGLFETTSDLVAKACADDGSTKQRAVVLAGTTIRRPRPGRARAYLIRKHGGLSPRKARDEAYLALLREDGAKRVWLTAVLLRIAGVWAYPMQRTALHGRSPSENDP